MTEKTKDVPNLGKIGDARLDLVPKLNETNCGMRPVEYNVIVAPAVMPEKIGLIHISDLSKERMEMAMQVGRLVAVSPLAFSYERWENPELRPKAGDIVWYGRFAGLEYTGIDGKLYRILKDKDVGAVINEPEESKLAVAV